MRPVAMLFGGESVRWYYVLHSGCIYRIILHSGEASPFLGKFTLPQTKKANLARHAARSLVVLDTNIEVERIGVSSPSYKDLMLSAETDVAVYSAVDDVSERLKDSDEFWQRHSATANAR